MNIELNTIPRRRDPSPWGTIDQVERLADGVYRVHTAGHGGIWLSPERRDRLASESPWVANLFRNVPAYCDKPTWWEEDCEALIPIFIWLDEMPAQYRSTPASKVASMITSIYGIEVAA